MSLPGGANIPGQSDNYNTSRGNSGTIGGIVDWVKGAWGGTKVTVGPGGGSATKTVAGIDFTYNWGTGKWYATDSGVEAPAGLAMDLGTPSQADFSQYALYALAAAVILYFMVKS